MPETIEITGIFGKKQRLTEDEFIGRWRAHASELYKLALTPDDYERVGNMVAWAENMAERQFEEILSKENDDA